MPRADLKRRIVRELPKTTVRSPAHDVAAVLTNP